MQVKLPEIIQNYIDASNRHDVKSIIACFSTDAIVHDEGEVLHGRGAIEGWIVKTIEKYQFQFKPLGVKGVGLETIVTVEISGTFDGSPINLDYHFTLENDEVVSLTIT